MTTTITMDLRFLTPAFLGGADQGAELRPPSIKGMLRFWYRALDPRFSERESALFGGAGDGTGQSRVLLRVDADEPALVRWDPVRAKRFTVGGGTHAKNGLVYLGYALQLRGNDNRTALREGTRFALRCVLPRPLVDERDRRALLATLWAFGTCGALGMRSRRGFGSLTLDGWKVAGTGADTWSRDMALLALSSSSRDATGWRRGFDEGRATIRGWLGGFAGKQGHPHLGDEARVRLSPEAQKGWEDAINHAGRQLQDFRQRMQPDYDNVKNHLRFRSGEGGVKLRAAPERAGFGLPLAFRYSSLRGSVTQTNFVPFEREAAERGKPLERHPSPLLLKLVALPDGLHSLWIRLDGPRPGTEPPAVERKAPRPLAPPSRDVVGDFFRTLDAGKEG